MPQVYQGKRHWLRTVRSYKKCMVPVMVCVFFIGGLLANGIVIRGTVTAVRGFGQGLCFVDMIAEHTGELQQALYKQQEFRNGTLSSYRQALLPGTQMELNGEYVLTRKKEPILQIQDARILSLPLNPQHVRKLLELATVEDGIMNDIATSLNTSSHDIKLKLEQNGIKKVAKELCPAKHIPVKHELPEAPLHFRTIPILNSPSTWVTVTGTILNRRRFLGNVTEIHLKDETSGDGTTSVLHPRILQNIDAEVLSHIFAPESLVRLVGIRSDNGTLWVIHGHLLRSSWRPATVRYIIEAVKQGKFNTSEASFALNVTYADITHISDGMSAPERRWKASEISFRLQNSSPLGVDSETEALCRKYENLRRMFPIRSVNDLPLTEVKYQESSRFSIKKDPQLQYFSREVKQLVEAHPSYGCNPKIQILDIGGGKGLLANRLLQIIGGDYVEVHVVDIAAGAIKNGMMRSKRQGFSVNYTLADASTFNLPGKIDIIVALHACGGLSDVALGLAVYHNASFVICPCCFCSNRELRVRDQRKLLGISDWLKIPHTDLYSLNLLAEKQGDSHMSNVGMHTVCALRSEAVERRSMSSIEVKLKSFPVAYSTRNVFLVGTKGGNKTKLRGIYD